MVKAGTSNNKYKVCPAKVVIAGTSKLIILNEINEDILSTKHNRA